MKCKFDLYEKAGVLEYWIVNYNQFLTKIKTYPFKRYRF